MAGIDPEVVGRTRAYVIAELTRQATRQGLQPRDLLPRELWKIEAALTGVTINAELHETWNSPQDLPD